MKILLRNVSLIFVQWCTCIVHSIRFILISMFDVQNNRAIICIQMWYDSTYPSTHWILVTVFFYSSCFDCYCGNGNHYCCCWWCYPIVNHTLALIKKWAQKYTHHVRNAIMFIMYECVEFITFWFWFWFWWYISRWWNKNVCIMDQSALLYQPVCSFKTIPFKSP